MPEKKKQFPVELDVRILAAIMRAQANRLEKTAKSVSNAEIAGEALLLWLKFDGLGLLDAVKEAKMLRARSILEKEQNGKSMRVEIDEDLAVDLLKAIKSAINGEMPDAS